MTALLAVLSLMVPAVAATATESAEVVLNADGLEPAQLQVAPGTTVTWHNDTGERRRVRDTQGPEDVDSGNLEPGDAFAHTFTAEGVTAYEDHRNDEDERFHGQVVVAADDGFHEGPVSMRDSQFSPPAQTIPVGGSIDWANDDDRPHTVTSNGGAFDSGVMDVGDEFSQSFAEPGTFSYVCQLHPEMTGTVRVVDGDGEAPSEPAPVEDEPVEDLPPPDDEPSVDEPVEDPPADGGEEPPGPEDGEAVAGGAAVSMVDNAFEPAEVEVAAGGTVTWRNDGEAPHTATGEGFDSGLTNPGESFSQSFAEPGTFSYVCQFHPEMTGTVRVVDGDGDAPPEQEAPLEAGAPGPGSGSDAPTPSGSASETTPPPASGSAGGASGPQRATVAIDDNVFVPASVAIGVGGTVEWAHDGVAMHTVTANDDSFDSGMLSTGDTYSQQFDQPGSYGYVCILHPGMAGTVVVGGSDDDATGPASAAAGSAGGSGGAASASGGAGPTAGGGGQTSGGSGGPSTLTVGMEDNFFDPASVDVTAGDTVRWVNQGAAPHTATGDAFDSGMVMAGGDYTRTFEEPGAFDYVCQVHPGMEGVVLVADADGQAPDHDGVASSQGDAGGSGGEGSSGEVALEAGEDAPMEVEVRAEDFYFDPEQVVVRQGGTVTWTMAGEAPHTVTDDGGAFDSGVRDPGDAFTHTYEELGTFAYVCELHPDMEGVVQVVEQSLDEADDLSGDAADPEAADSEGSEDDAAAAGPTPTSATGFLGRASTVVIAVSGAIAAGWLLRRLSRLPAPRWIEDGA